MIIRDPEKLFDELWETFNNRYPFFKLRGVDWQVQYDKHRPRVMAGTSDEELFHIFCQMLDPLDDGHVELKAKLDEKGQEAYLHCGEEAALLSGVQGFSDQSALSLRQRKRFSPTASGALRTPAAWMLRYCRSQTVGYIRILELEGVKKGKLTTALDTIAVDFKDLQGFIIDIRDNPGGDDSIAVAIINRFCDRERVAFYRRTKIGPGDDAFKPLKTFLIKPEGEVQFTGPIVLLTCDAVFSGGEAFALAIKQLPYVTIVGDHTNGIFSYQLEKKLANGWEYCLSYQEYLSPDMICYEAKGVPADIVLLNSTADIENGVDPLITGALEVLTSKQPVA